MLAETVEGLVARATAAGLPVATVDPHETTQLCHACGELADGVLVCTTEACHVDEVWRDRSAAATIAKRAPQL